MLFKWHREAGVLGAEWTWYKPQGWAGLLQASTPVGSSLHLGREAKTNPRTRGKYAILSSLPGSNSYHTDHIKGCKCAGVQSNWL